MRTNHPRYRGLAAVLSSNTYTTERQGKESIPSCFCSECPLRDPTHAVAEGGP